MRRLILLPTLLVLLTAAPVLAGTDIDEVAAEVADTGLYVEPGVGANRTSLFDSIARAGNEGVRLMVVLLNDDPAGGATTYADAVLDRVGNGSVLVLTAFSEGMSSTDFEQSVLEEALDRGLDAAEDAPSGQGDEAFVSTVADVLIAASGGTPVTTTTAPRASTGGGGFPWTLVIIVGGIVLFVWFLIRRGNKQSAAGKASMIEEARSEIRSQLDAMANTILEITDQVNASSASEDDSYLRQASATFTEADDAFAAATDLAALEALADRLDEARWQLDAAAAIADGKPVPEKPVKEERHACFFDPTHGNATETAEIKTPAGTKTVRVCKEDAEKLRRGTQPKPRMIEVDGRQVPAPMAPRSYGGGGFDWLDVFSILAGGAGEAASYDWGGGRSSAGRSSSSRGRSWSPGSSTSSGRTSTRSSSSGTRSRAGRTRNTRRNR